MIGSLVRALRERRQTVNAFGGCARPADLLEAGPGLDSLSFCPAWELARLPKGKRITPVMLLDTFEGTGNRTHRYLKCLLQRVVPRRPGRPRGPARRTLQRGVERQGLAGDASPMDCDDYLAGDRRPATGE
ncbi:hypothetical protein ACFVW1_46590 [Streptomyces olivochromogenes]|uniref:hypothetical protein n=1 Tax=Streptomyces olivochromogenes TaxID=1963 RepID=UPI0036D809FA